jgi:hypothetical protein
MRADDGDRTRDPRLGKPMLCQLSYVRASVILTRDGGDRPRADDERKRKRGVWPAGRRWFA